MSTGKHRDGGTIQRSRMKHQRASNTYMYIPIPCTCMVYTANCIMSCIPSHHYWVAAPWFSTTQLGKQYYLIDERDFLCCRPENALRTLLLAPLGVEKTVLLVEPWGGGGVGQASCAREDNCIPSSSENENTELCS